jgi:Zn-dependent protease with chaperone function
MTIGSSILLIAIGAILKYAVTAHVSGINIQTAGTVLLILGIVGLILSVLYTFVWSRQRPSEVRVRDERDPRYDEPRY